MSNKSKKELRQERILKRHKQQKINAKLKKKLFGHLFMAPCYYCKFVFLYLDLTVEHIIPLCLGGTNDPDNITLSCGPCNHERGREAWFQKTLINKEYYEQHHKRDQEQNRESPVQTVSSPIMYSQEPSF